MKKHGIFNRGLTLLLGVILWTIPMTRAGWPDYEQYPFFSKTRVKAAEYFAERKDTHLLNEEKTLQNLYQEYLGSQKRLLIIIQEMSESWKKFETSTDPINTQIPDAPGSQIFNKYQDIIKNQEHIIEQFQSKAEDFFDKNGIYLFL